MINIGVIEDDPVHSELVGVTLERAGFGVVAFGSAHEFLRRRTSDIDLILLDWQLPGDSGLDLLRALRAEETDERMPVIFLTGHGEEDKVVEALNAGADDYVVKPARPAELVARVEAVLRRRGVADVPPELDFPPFRFRPEQRDVLLNGAAVTLSSREYELLWFLFQRHGRIVGRETLLRQVWRIGPEVNTRTVDTHISRLRKRLGLNGDSGWRLAAIYHHGYRLQRMGGELESVAP
jgi:DNA-binding response OmpR family regulator